MTEIWVQMIVGQNREPYLEAALQSVAWADGFSVANTDPEGRGYGQQNEQIIRRTIPREKLHLERVAMSNERFDFARARNTSMELIPADAYVLIVDADDVHWPAFEQVARQVVADGYDIATVHFYHLAVFKDLLHSVRHREILFQKTADTHFERGVHELLVHPRANPLLVPGSYHYEHLGYVRPAREVAARWEFYRTLGAEIHDYDVSDPDHALDDWPRVCTPFWREHPPAVRELLESYPPAPRQDPQGPTAALLVLLTWNDAENLRDCLKSLWTTDTPFWLVVVDNGSTDETLDILGEYKERVDGTPEEMANGKIHGDGPCRMMSVERRCGLSLAQALNVGFSHVDGWVGDYTPPYIGWIHPDMTFDWPDWLGQLAKGLDEHPEWVKLGAQEADDGRAGLRPGNSQCYLVRRSALAEVGLFNESFLACGGYEDWESNARLLKVGAVMITPEAMVRHKAMGTRSKHDNNDAARQNADLYHELVGQWEPMV